MRPSALAATCVGVALACAPFLVAPTAMAGTSSYTVVSSPNLGGDLPNQIDALADVSPADAWAVGSYDNNTAPLVEHWVNGRWHRMSVPVAGGQNNSNDYLASVTAPGPDAVWAVGQTQDQEATPQPLVEHWDGTNWTQGVPQVTSPNAINTLAGISADTTSDVWAVGSYQGNLGTTETLIERWQGSTWNIVASPNPVSDQNSYLIGVDALTTSNAWAIGYNGTNNGDEAPLAEQWNGTSWNIVPFPDPNAAVNCGLTSISVENPDNIWAAGNIGWTQSPTVGPTGSFLAHWNGTVWTIIHTPTDGLEESSQVNAVQVTGPSAAIAVGALGNQPLIEQWNGSAWSLLPAPNAGATGQYTFEAAAASSGADVWIGGNLVDSQDQPEPVFAHFGALPSPPPGSTPTPPPAGNPYLGDILIVVGLIVAGGGWYGWNRYQKQQQEDELNKGPKNPSGPVGGEWGLSQRGRIDEQYRGGSDKPF